MATKPGRSLFVIGILAKIHLSQAKEYCEADYYCETGHCCAQNKCCAYYYELWWFWVIWAVVAAIGLCCFYQQRRRKLRRQRCHRQRHQHQTQQLGSVAAQPTSNTVIQNGSQQFHRPVFDVDKMFHLPSYDEAQQQVGAPPAYSQLYSTTLPQTALTQPATAAAGPSDTSVHSQSQRMPATLSPAQAPQDTSNTNTNMSDVSRRLFLHQQPGQVMSGRDIPTTNCQVLSAAEGSQHCDYPCSLEEQNPLDAVPVDIDDSMTANLLDNTEDQEFLGTLQLMSPQPKHH